jgi:hypothetical protein
MLPGSHKIKNRRGNRRNGGRYDGRWQLAPVHYLWLDGHHRALAGPMTCQHGNCAQVGQSDLMHRGLSIAQQESVHCFALEQAPCAGWRTDVGGVDNNEGVGILNGASQGK